MNDFNLWGQAGERRKSRFFRGGRFERVAKDGRANCPGDPDLRGLNGRRTVRKGKKTVALLKERTRCGRVNGQVA